MATAGIVPVVRVVASIVRRLGCLVAVREAVLRCWLVAVS